MNKILDFYFKRPVFWDYFIGLLLSFLILKTLISQNFDISDINELKSTLSDLSNISLTSAGFILTLLTLLITFKSSSKLKIEDAKTSDSRFDIFFSSKLYFSTVMHLKKCIKSLILIAIVGYILKLGTDNRTLVYFVTILSIFIVVITLWRCLLILSKILELQKNNKPV